MKWFNRIEVRLIGLIVLVVAATNLITLGISVYSTQRNIRELPRDVRDVLQAQERSEGAALPWPVSKRINGLLSSGQEVVVRLETTADGSQERVFWLRSLGGDPQPIRVSLTPPPPRPDFRTRLQQSLLIATLASSVLGVLLALIFSRRLARPIEAVSGAATRLASGDLSARIPAPKGNDETALLARNFNRMAEALEKLETERKALIADIAHELRTPLTIMQGRLEAIQDGVASLEMREIDRLHNQTRLLSRLVEDLRTLSLADAGRLTLERRPLDLRGVIHNAVAGFQDQAQIKGIKLQTRLPPLPLEVEADPDRLTQIVSNLLHNALAHTPTGGTITIEVEAKGKEVAVQVADTGPGIPEEALPKVFDRFFRAEASRSRQTGGSGLGLSIVKALVELHGGQVEARNRSSGGAEFRFLLPQRLGSRGG
ncbi:MAG TPA: ATP-binding protein [Meiothermus sp.]|jgi:two-component system sensor histidine kinase BaeS|nr:ATP-binding protein [Meiothermus sp.]